MVIGRQTDRAKKDIREADKHGDGHTDRLKADEHVGSHTDGRRQAGELAGK